MEDRIIEALNARGIITSDFLQSLIDPDNKLGTLDILAMIDALIADGTIIEIEHAAKDGYFKYYVQGGFHVTVRSNQETVEL